SGSWRGACSLGFGPYRPEPRPRLVPRYVRPRWFNQLGPVTAVTTASVTGVDGFSCPDCTRSELAATRLTTALIPQTRRIKNPHEIVRRMMEPLADRDGQRSCRGSRVTWASKRTRPVGFPSHHWRIVVGYRHLARCV